MQLPTEVELRHCPADNFMFVSGGRQRDYNEYYTAVVNDSYHREVAAGASQSPIARLQYDRLTAVLGDFFAAPRKVLDFGCGEAALLLMMAARNPASTFFGFELSAAAQTATREAEALGLKNVRITGLEESATSGPYDLIVVSHVLEHLIDLDVIALLRGLLTDDGILYIEVPDALRYESHQRTEYLYYFDRLHVNHFTPQSLSRLMTGYGLGYVKHFGYAFPYRDGGEYPALGMLFQKGGGFAAANSLPVLEATNRYIRNENARARSLAGELDAFDGVLIWGAGDNFYRSIENEGPLSALRNVVLLDRRPREIAAGDRTYQAIDPDCGVRSYSWPVVVTVSEGKQEIRNRVAGIDPSRQVFFV
jgi:SAM-dependent methyltransferase